MSSAIEVDRVDRSKTMLSLSRRAIWRLSPQCSLADLILPDANNRNTRNHLRLASTGSIGHDYDPENSTTPVARLYIAPAILMVPLDSMPASTGLSLRMLAICSSTF